MRFFNLSLSYIKPQDGLAILWFDITQSLLFITNLIYEIKSCII